MKRVMLVGVVLLLAGCNSGSTGDDVLQSESSTESTKVMVAVNNEEAIQHLGEGELTVFGDTGRPVKEEKAIVYNDGKSPVTVNIEANEIDGSRVSYISVDDELIHQEKVAGYSGVYDLKEKTEFIPEGNHQVRLVQYEDDKTDGEMVTLLTKEFLVKNKN